MKLLAFLLFAGSTAFAQFKQPDFYVRTALNVAAYTYNVQASERMFKRFGPQSEQNPLFSRGTAIATVAGWTATDAVLNHYAASLPRKQRWAVRGVTTGLTLFLAWRAYYNGRQCDALR